MVEDSVFSIANITGDISSPNLKGIAYFKPFKDGTMVEVEVSGLPGYKNYALFPIHVHDGKDCSLSKEGMFENVLGHYNPTNEEHPYHAGDMPILFSNNGYAYMKFYTTRFKAYEVEGKLVIIHEAVTDENAKTFGRKIGCGVIKKYKIWKKEPT